MERRSGANIGEWLQTGGGWSRCRYCSSISEPLVLPDDPHFSKKLTEQQKKKLSRSSSSMDLCDVSLNSGQFNRTFGFRESRHGNYSAGFEIKGAEYATTCTVDPRSPSVPRAFPSVLRDLIQRNFHEGFIFGIQRCRRFILARIIGSASRKHCVARGSGARLAAGQIL